MGLGKMSVAAQFEKIAEDFITKSSDVITNSINKFGHSWAIFTENTGVSQHMMGSVSVVLGGVALGIFCLKKAKEIDKNPDVVNSALSEEKDSPQIRALKIKLFAFWLTGMGSIAASIFTANQIFQDMNRNN